MADRIQDIIAHLHNEVQEGQAPSTHHTPFLEVESIGEIEEEDQIMLKAGNGQEVLGFMLQYGDGEVYQVFIWGGKRV